MKNKRVIAIICTIVVAVGSIPFISMASNDENNIIPSNVIDKDLYTNEKFDNLNTEMICDHYFKIDEETSIKETCTTEGTYYMTCILCGATDVKTMPAKGHNLYDSGREPLCDKDGFRVKWCSRCDYSEKTIIPMLGHTWGVSKQRTDGSYFKECEVCGEEENINNTNEHDCNLLGHEYESEDLEWDDINKTCNVWRKCSWCGHVETDIAEQILVSETAATCEHTGIERWKAHFNIEVSDKLHNIIIPQKEHEWISANNAVEPTCIKPGKNSDIICKNCNAVQSEGKEISPLDHIYNNGKCIRCGIKNNNTDKIEQTNEHIHSWSIQTVEWNDDNTKATATIICTKDKSHVISETGVAVKTVRTEPTCVLSGRMLCTVNFSDPNLTTEMKLEKIPRLNHKLTKQEDSINPTCTHAGRYATTICERCGMYTEGWDIPMVSHVYKNGVCLNCGISSVDAAAEPESGCKDGSHKYMPCKYSWDYNNNTCTAKRNCRNCSEVESETVNTKSVITVQPTCENGGVKEITATFKNPAFTKTVTKIAISSLGHIYDSKTQICMRCNKKNSGGTASNSSAKPATPNNSAAVKPTVPNKSKAVKSTITSRDTTSKSAATNSNEKTKTITMSSSTTTKTVVTDSTQKKQHVHDWDWQTAEWNDDCTQVTARRVCLLDKSHVITETVVPERLVTKEATCTVGATVLCIGHFSNPDLYEELKYTRTSRLNHKWVKQEDYVEPNCDLSGRRPTSTCERCGMIDNGWDLLASGHRYVDGTCVRCGKIQDGTVVGNQHSASITQNQVNVVATGDLQNNNSAAIEENQTSGSDNSESRIEMKLQIDQLQNKADLLSVALEKILNLLNTLLAALDFV